MYRQVLHVKYNFSYLYPLDFHLQNGPQMFDFNCKNLQSLGLSYYSNWNLSIIILTLEWYVNTCILATGEARLSPAT